MIFSRQRGGSGRHSASDASGPAKGRKGRPDTGDPSDDVRPTEGPFDIADAPDDGLHRLDLGALQVPALEGVELRVEAGPQGNVQQIVLVHGDSALQVGVFAAPRTEGIWDEVRDEIYKSLISDGAQAEEVEGAYGVALRARVPSPQGLMELRFIGVDGPRWFVRAVYQGAAAGDPSAAPELDAALRNLVVSRGNQAMPVREALPLRLPDELAEQFAAQQSAQQAAEESGPPPGAGGPPRAGRGRANPASGQG